MPDFVARAEELASLRDILDKGHVTITQPQEWTGPTNDGNGHGGHHAAIGGVGKTALAIEYTKKAAGMQSYALVRWIESRSDIIEHQFCAFAADLSIDTADLSLAQVATAVYARLAELPLSYLIVFDDAESIDLIVDLLPPARPAPTTPTPPSPLAAGHTQAGRSSATVRRAPLRHAIVTTRSSEPGWPNPMMIKAFSGMEAEHLCELQLPLSDPDAIAGLLKRVEHNPLCLAQALAHVAVDEIMEEDYVKDFDKHAEAWRQRHGGVGGGATPATLPIAAAHSIVLRLSLRNISAANALAASIVRAASYLGAVGIPAAVFTCAGVVRALGVPVLGSAEHSQAAVNAAVSTLREYRLCRGTHLVRINRAVQSAARHLDADEEVDVLQARLVPLMRALTAMLPGKIYKKQHYELLMNTMPHLQACLDHAAAQHTALTMRDVDFATVDAVTDAHCMLGNGYQQLGLYAKGFLAFKAAYRLAVEPKCAKQLTELRRATIMHRFGNICRIYGIKKQTLGLDTESTTFLQNALKLLMKVLQTYMRQPKKDLALIAATYGDMAAVARGQAATADKAPPTDIESDAELQYLKRAVKIESTLHGTDHVRVSEMFGHLARCYKRLGDEAKYHKLLEDSLKLQERHYIRDNTEVCVTLTMLGTSAGHRGNYAGAIKYLERALRIREQHDNKAQITAVLRLLATAHGKLGDLDKKKALLQRALGIQAKHFGKHHVGVGNITAALGIVYGEMGDTQKKLKLLQKALGMQRLFLGSWDPEVARTLTNIGNTHAMLGKYDAAKEALEEALETKERCFGADHIEVAATLCSLGCVLVSLNELHQAKALLSQALYLKQQHYGASHPELTRTLLNLGNVLGCLGDGVGHAQSLRRVLAIKEAQADPGAELEVAYLLDELVLVLGPAGAEAGDGQAQVRARAHAQEKRGLLLRVLAIYRRHYGETSLKLVPVLLAMSVSFDTEQDWVAKRQCLEEALSIQENNLGRSHEDLVSTLAQLAWAWAATQEPELGVAVMRRGMEIATTADPNRLPPGLVGWIHLQFSSLVHAMNSQPAMREHLRAPKSPAPTSTGTGASGSAVAARSTRPPALNDAVGKLGSRSPMIKRGSVLTRASIDARRASLEEGNEPIFPASSQSNTGDTNACQTYV